MKLSAPAKVNLHLRILARREDGFHALETLMVPVTLADEISVSVSTGRTVTLTCDDPNVPLGADNLAVRAATEFARATGRKFSAQIAITKKIPMGAGLGGGSSDAASVLLALDAIFETGLGVEALQKIGATLGSDVPFFIGCRTAWCRGRGEIIEPFTLPERFSIFLIKPPFGVSTPQAYHNWAASRDLPGDLSAGQDLGWTQVINSLERPVFEKHLFLPVMKQWLLAQPEVRVAAMSGSGSTMFAILRSGEQGAALQKRAAEYFGPHVWSALCMGPHEKFAGVRQYAK